MSSKLIKSIVIGIPVFVGILLLGTVVTFSLISEEVLTDWLMQSISTKAEANITYESIDLERGLTTRIDIQQLEVVAHDDSYQVGSSYLRLSIRLPQLLLARLDFPSLEIGDTRIHIKGDPEGDTRDSLRPGIDLDALHLRPILREVSLMSLSVSAEDSKWKLPARSTVSELSMHLTPDENVPELSADIKIVDEKLNITATLPNFHQSIGKRHLPFNIRVNRPFAVLSVQGDVDFGKADSRVKAALNFQVDELGKIPAMGALQVPGSLMLSAAIDGTFDKLPVESINGRWQAGEAGEAELSGRIDNLIGLQGIALALKAHARNADWLKPHLSDSMEVVEEATLSFSLNGTEEKLVADGVQLKAKTADGLDVDLSGEFDLVNAEPAGYEVRNIQARLDFKSPTTRAARVFLFEDIPEFGALTAGADIKSVQGHPTFSNITVNTRHPLGIEAKLGGIIDSFPLDPNTPNEGYNLDVSIKSPEAKPVLDALDLDLPLPGALDITFKIQGDTVALQLNDIHLVAGSRQAVNIKADGNMLFGDWSRDDPLESLDISVDAYSHTADDLAALVDEDWPNLGAMKLRFRMHSLAAGKHRVDDYSLSTVEGARVQLAITGSASELTVFPSLFIRGMQLKFDAQGEDITDLNKLLALDEVAIPPIGAFKAQSDITGSDDSINVSNVRARAGSEDVLLFTAYGRLGKLDRQTGWAFYDTDLKLAAESDDSQVLAKVLGHKLPPLGPLSGTAEIRDVKKRVSMEKLILRVGIDTNDPVLVVQGNVGNLPRFTGVDLKVNLNIDGHDLAAFADRQGLKDLSPIGGELYLADKNGTLGIQTLQLRSDHPDLIIDVKGQYPDFDKPETLQLKTDIQARDLALVGALFGRRWPDYRPVNINGVIGREGNRVQLNANVRAAKKGLDAVLHGDFTTTPPSFAGKLVFHHLSLPDFFEEATKSRKEWKKTEEEKYKKLSRKEKKVIKKKKEEALKQPVFSNDPIAFDNLKKLDLALAVEVATFDPTDSEAVSAESTVRLKSGVLTLRPAVIRYPKGELNVDAGIDAREVPKLSLKMHGESINPWLAQAEHPNETAVSLDAKLNIDVDLSAQGSSAHEIASSLDGSLYMTTKDGKVQRSFTNLLFADIVGWTADFVKEQKYSDLRCGVADLSSSQGVVKTNGFYMDTTDIAITGDGTIDLGKEEVDLVFLPKKKSRVILSAEPVKVRGSLRDPSVTAIPVKSAALTFGTLVFAPFVFVGMTASGYLTEGMANKKEDTPCLTYERKHPIRNSLETLPTNP